MLLAITAARLGLCNPEHFGAGRLVAVVAGAGLLACSALVRERHLGLLGSAVKAASRPYRDLSIIVFTTLLLLGCIEGACLLINRISLAADPRAGLSYYRGQAWSARYWTEHARAFDQDRYQPFVVWRNAPFQGEMINIDANGIRRTPGAEASPKSYRVFVFGGSAVMGFGSPDWGTIPAYLQEDLGRRFPSASVTNFGALGWVSTQSVFLLIRQLQAGNVPNLVIFYDGANECSSAAENGRADGHAGQRRISMQLEHPLLGELLASNLSIFLLPKLDRLERHLRRPAPDGRLASEVVDTYLSNYRTVEALASQYGFRFEFFLQPLILTGRKVLTTEERGMIPEMQYSAPGVAELASGVYQMIGARAPRLANLRSLTDVFDAQKSQIWIDWCHVTPEGNRIVAAAMAEALR
jgi:hypothetical protein